MRPRPDAPVIALDIDGTSGDYHSHFTAFAAQYTGKPMPFPWTYTGGVPFHKHLHISRRMYNEIKLAYRRGGAKRSMPVYEGMGEFTRYVRNKGVAVWICTTRPYLSLENIDADTRHWLSQRAHMQYDGILFGPHKYRDLVKQVGKDRVLVVYEDLPRFVDQALDLGLRAMLRTQPYNHQYARSGNWGRVSSVEDMRSVFDWEHTQWRNNHE
jgi:phosphoglycolate phosphatase-like HAD superfamily hydrolase